MLSENFKYAYSALSVQEGGWVDNSKDRGGETYAGIRKDLSNTSLVFLWEFMRNEKRKGRLKTGMVFHQFDEVVMQYYHENYWMPLRLDELTSELSHDLFDIAVNHGKGKAVVFLQRALNMLNKCGTLWENLVVDGLIGNKTIAACKEAIERNDTHVVLIFIKVLRGYHYVEIMETDHTEDQEEFARGWAKRIRI